VLDEIQKALAGSGLELKIESIEFAAFAPKIYLNRVTIKTNQSAPVVFPNPIGIDKVKIEFSPIALISGRIVIEDAALFHPRIILPSADQLYRKVDEQLKSRKRVELLQEAIETERLPMRCIGCGERIAATPEQARKHGYEVWPGGCRCPTCQQPDVVPVDAIGARVKELEVI
jgi:hypothetical protein